MGMVVINKEMILTKSSKLSTYESLRLLEGLFEIEKCAQRK
jgi:hypothetical protein